MQYHICYHKTTKRVKACLKCVVNAFLMLNPLDIQVILYSWKSGMPLIMEAALSSIKVIILKKRFSQLSNFLSPKGIWSQQRFLKIWSGCFRTILNGFTTKNSILSVGAVSRHFLSTNILEVARVRINLEKRKAPIWCRSLSHSCESYISHVNNANITSQRKLSKRFVFARCYV